MDKLNFSRPEAQKKFAQLPNEEKEQIIEDAHEVANRENIERTKDSFNETKKLLDLNDPETVKSSCQLIEYMKNRPVWHQDDQGGYVDDGKIDIDINKPLEQWTEDEIGAFIMIFNNFPELFPARAPDRLPSCFGEDDEECEKQIQKEMKLVEDARAAFIKHGIETDEFKKKIEEYKKSMRGDFGELPPEKYGQKIRDLSFYIEFHSLPAIFDLLDSGKGYSLSDII